MSCGFQGNSDIFGVGIRAAYYLQIFAVWFSNYFYHREAKVLRAVNKIFLLAIIVAGLLYFVNAQQRYAIEAFLLLQIGIVTGLVGITEATRYSTQYRATSKERLIIRIFIMVCGALFNVVFWWIGLDLMMPTPCNGTNSLESATYAFYGWKINMYGWLRIAMKVQSIWVISTVVMMHVSKDGASLVFTILMKEKRAIFVDILRESALSRCPSGPSNIVSRQQNESKFSDQISIFDQMRIDSLPIATKSAVTNERKEDSGTLSAVSRATTSANGAFLREVRQAEQYLDLLYSIYVENDTCQVKQTTKRSSCAFFSKSKRLPKYQCTDQTPYLKCLWTWTVATVTNNPSVSARNILFFHEVATGNHAGHQTPRLVSRMYNLSFTTTTPDWRFLKIASDIHLSQIPSTTKTRTGTNQAVLQFLFIALLIVQVELTIVWNGVSGLQSFSNLGQLIPFIIGLGGLLKVLWGKACLIWEGVAEEPDRYELKGEYELALESYVERKEAFRGRLPVRVATA